MTLETLYYISQIVAVLAILGSLIFVGIQIRQNTKQAEEAERVARGQVVQHIAAENREHALATLPYPEVYRCFVEATDPADMNDDDRARVATYCFATLHMVQNIYFQHGKGLLDDQTYPKYEAGRRSRTRCARPVQHIAAENREHALAHCLTLRFIDVS